MQVAYLSGEMYIGLLVSDLVILLFTTRAEVVLVHTRTETNAYGDEGGD